MIQFDRVVLLRGGRMVLQEVTCDILPGELVCLAGENGAGKTTFLRLLLALERPTQGQVMVDGVDLARLPSSLLRKYRQGLGVLFEESMLLPDRTVAENVAYPLEVQGAARREALLRAEELLQSVALTERGKAFPSTLHQGEQRIVALLRAIAHRPKIVLLDELTTGVDARSADVLLSLTREIHRSGTTVLLATREPSVIVKLRARVLDLERGRVVRDSRLRHASSSPLTV